MHGYVVHKTFHIDCEIKTLGQEFRPWGWPDMAVTQLYNIYFYALLQSLLLGPSIMLFLKP